MAQGPMSSILVTIRITIRIQESVQSPKSTFTSLSKKLPTDFDEILWRAGVWPRDQLITFCWRSASLSGSGSPFRMTIGIREELPRCQHIKNRCPAKIVQQCWCYRVRQRSVLSEYFWFCLWEDLEFPACFLLPRDGTGRCLCSKHTKSYNVCMILSMLRRSELWCWWNVW